MLNKHSLITLALLSSTQVFAVPIESNRLSGNSSNTNPANISAAGANSAAISSNMNWDLLQQNQRLENQLRELRGKIEEQDYQIDQLNKELTNRYTDLDQRLELLQQKIDPSEEEPQAEGEAGTNTATEPTKTAASNLSTETATASNSSSTNAVSSNQAELDKAAYTIALDAYKQGGAKKAIAPMQNFIKNNPNSVYTGNAYFWLAEFNLAIEPPNYTEAKKNYETVAAKYPDSAKAPRSLYQLYSIAKDVNKNTQSAEVYKKKLLSSYPQSEEAGYFKQG